VEIIVVEKQVVRHPQAWHRVQVPSNLTYKTMQEQLE
jgi:hypothetical protein